MTIHHDCLVRIYFADVFDEPVQQCLHSGLTLRFLFIGHERC